MSRSYNTGRGPGRDVDNEANHQRQPRQARQGLQLSPLTSFGHSSASDPSGHQSSSHSAQRPPPPPSYQPPLDPITYMHHPSLLAPSPSLYRDSRPASSQQPQFFSHPGHISPASSQTSNTSSFTVPDSHIHRNPQGLGHTQPQYSPHPQSRAQQQNSHTQHQQPRSTMGASLSRSSASSRLPPCPNLLGEHRIDALEGIQFELKMRQQPRAARSCGFGDKDRRVVDPPPIIELIVKGPKMTREDVTKYLRYEQYVMSCALRDETGTQDASIMPDNFNGQRRLMGSLVATPFYGLDEKDKEGCFFAFSDLSCRQPGPYRLSVSLTMFGPTMYSAVGHFPTLAQATSDVFTVYNAKDFPGMAPSSPLARRLKEQGCILSIKKGADRPRRAETENDPLFAEEYDDEDEDGGNGAESLAKRTRHI